MIFDPEIKGSPHHESEYTLALGRLNLLFAKFCYSSFGSISH